MQRTGLAGIATAGAGMVPSIDPPRCRKCIIAADNGDAGQNNALATARPKYPDCEVCMATPVKPKALRFNKTKRTIVPGGLPSGSNFNEVACPARASGTLERKGEIAKLSSLLAPQPRPPPVSKGPKQPPGAGSFHFNPKVCSPWRRVHRTRKGDFRHDGQKNQHQGCNA